MVGLEGADGVTGVAGLEGAAGVAGVEGAAGVTGLAGVEVEGLACGPLPPPLLHAVTANKAAQKCCCFHSFIHKFVSLTLKI